MPKSMTCQRPEEEGGSLPFMSSLTYTMFWIRFVEPGICDVIPPSEDLDSY
jgi:hypothetical protein